VRVSLRARQVRLVMSARDGLVVVIPRGFDRRRIPGILERKARWIEQAAARVETRRQRLEAEASRFPESIVLRSPDETWLVEYLGRTRVDGPRTTEQGSSTVPRRSSCSVRELPGNRLVVHGDVDDPAACHAALKRWLLRKARTVLVPRLLILAREHGFVVQDFSVRSQRGRWASCSRRGAISLNMKLLFLPRDLSDHVLLHELCHLRHMDHSAAFWGLMRERDSDSESKNRLLRVASQHVPAWLDAGAAGSERWTPSL
jgi:predicted metal-dependent hydrolase